MIVDNVRIANTTAERSHTVSMFAIHLRISHSHTIRYDMT